jgi:hypothetical protein
MPLMNDVSALDSQNTPHGFQFSNMKIDLLGASEYTIGVVVTDLTGSVGGFHSDLIDVSKSVLEACRKHPKAENFLLRSTVFNSDINVKEIHGFNPVNSIDSTIYDGFPFPSGSTPLMDAHLEACESLYQFGNQLAANQFTVNAVLFIITDGGENSSANRDMDTIKKIMARLRNGDPLESFTAILIGVNDSYDRATLKQYQVESTIDEYKSIGDATPGSIAKVAQFISKSLSTASQSLGGGTSKQLSSNIASLTI